MHTWDDVVVPEMKAEKWEENDVNAALIRKSSDSEGHSNNVSDEAQTTQSSDLGENGKAFYHEPEGSMENKLQEQKFRKQLNRDAREAIADSVHGNVKLIVHRPEVTEANREEYYTLLKKLTPVIKGLVRKTEPILEHETCVNFARQHVYGSRFCAESIINKDFRYFAKKLPPEEEVSLTVALRIDESASMKAFGRLQAAKLAAVAVYEFCTQCKIPILIYGDTADRSRLVTVYHFSCCCSSC